MDSLQNSTGRCWPQAPLPPAGWPALLIHSCCIPPPHHSSKLWAIPRPTFLSVGTAPGWEHHSWGVGAALGVGGSKPCAGSGWLRECWERLFPSNTPGILICHVCQLSVPHPLGLPSSPPRHLPRCAVKHGVKLRQSAGYRRSCGSLLLTGADLVAEAAQSGQAHFRTLALVAGEPAPPGSAVAWPCASAGIPLAVRARCALLPPLHASFAVDAGPL